jgi:hypothetical protein
LISDEQADYRKLAIAHSEQALARCDPDTYLLHNLHARLGVARDWAAALPAWEQAIALGDSMLDAAYTTVGRQSEAGTVAEAYRTAAYCCCGSVGAPTLITATPPLSLAARSRSCSRSKSLLIVSICARICVVRAAMACLSP